MAVQLTTKVKMPTTSNTVVLQSTEPYKGHIVTFFIGPDPGAQTSDGWIYNSSACIEATVAHMNKLDRKEPPDTVIVEWSGTGLCMSNVKFI